VSPGEDPARHGFEWPEAETDVDRDETPPGTLPRSGPLADFAAAGLILSEPSGDPTRPLVVAVGDRVVKAYDLRAFDALDQRRALVEAETAVALSGIEGIVTTYRIGEVGNWLVIEMERLGTTLAAHIERRERGAPELVSPARWGQLLEGVALALAEVHGRGIVHRDVKPANLMFDRAGKHLLLADFSIAIRRHRSQEPDAAVAGTRRYIAPELFQGRIGFAADQYGLAVTAAEALGEGASAAAKEVLLRATEQEPEDRYSSVADFGVALRAAIDDRNPYRLSSRLRRVSPRWRATWSSGAATFVAAYLVILAMRSSSLNELAGLGLPALCALLAMGTARLFSRLRGRRSQARLKLADNGVFPVATFLVAMLAARPLYADEPGDLDKYLLYAWLGSFALAAFLGSTPRDSGEWLIRLTQRWERWRRGHLASPQSRWGYRLALVTGLVLFSALPGFVGNRWESAPAPEAREYAALLAVARTRAAMLDGGADRICALMRIPIAEAGTVRCRRWAPVTANWLRGDVRGRGGPALTPATLGDYGVSYSDGTERHGSPTWSIWTDDGNRDNVGILSEIDADGGVWEVAITRRPPDDDPLGFQRAFWGYEIVRQDGGWWITSIEVCGWTDADCARITQVPGKEWSATVRSGAPE
jgi:tRNA A-37 threonylcarbamoyl transferase component Bud32